MPDKRLTIPFVKMHGIGNDYIYLDAIGDPTLLERNLPQLARAVSDRHTGIGGDGLIVLAPPRPGIDAHLRMRMFNADGSESEMCGNGIRCVCKLAYDDHICREQPMRIDTGAGVLSLDYTLGSDARVAEVAVDMGTPVLDLARVPVDEGALSWYASETHLGAIAIDSADTVWVGAFVSTGNPHVVFFDDENSPLTGDGLAKLDLDRIGPPIEHHAAFPNRINAHFVQVISPTEVTMRTWERGSGITLACGTGACAVCVAGAITGKTERTILAHLPGGDLRLRWDPTTRHIVMTGPATEAFRGHWPLAAQPE